MPRLLVLKVYQKLLDQMILKINLKKKIKNPLDKIVEGMESLKSGNHNARIDIQTEAEFEKMKEDFYEKYLKENKDYYLDENGILYLKGYGALGNNSYCNELASEFKTDEELVESILSEIKKEEV